MGVVVEQGVKLRADRMEPLDCAWQVGVGRTETPIKPLTDLANGQMPGWCGIVGIDQTRGVEIVGNRIHV